jgi:hypothetical protein
VASEGPWEARLAMAAVVEGTAAADLAPAVAAAPEAAALALMQLQTRSRRAHSSGWC